MVSVAETEKLLTEILGAPIKAVAYAKGYKTSTGKVLAIHPTQKAPRIWYQPPVAPQMEGVSNISSAKNDDLVGELAVLRKGHDTPRVQIETANGLKSFLAWYAGTTALEVPLELEGMTFFASAMEKSIIEIKYSVKDTVARSKGQREERTVKDKQLLMTDAELENLIRRLLDVQEGLCAITGLPFQYRGSHEDENMLPSLDRIDSDGHYSRENLQLVCRFINFWKQASDDDEFRRLINLVRGVEARI